MFSYSHQLLSYHSYYLLVVVSYYQQNAWTPFRGQSINEPRVPLYSSVQCASPGYQCCGSGSGGSVINWPPGPGSGGSVINWPPASGPLFFFYQRFIKNVRLRSVNSWPPGSGSVNQVYGSECERNIYVTTALLDTIGRVAFPCYESKVWIGLENFHLNLIFHFWFITNLICKNLPWSKKPVKH